MAADAGGPILVVGPAWVGDMVMAQSVFIDLRARHGDVAIDVLAPPWTLPLLRFMPEVRAGLAQTVDRGRLGLKERWHQARVLRDNGYRRAILLPNSFKSALAPLWAGIPVRTGYRREARGLLLTDGRRLDPKRHPRTVDRFVALVRPKKAAAEPVPQPRFRVDEQAVADALAAVGLDPPDRPVLALCPGAEYGPAKRWPVAYFAEIAKAAEARGADVWLFGSAADRPVTEAIADAAPAVVDLAGRTSLAEAVALLSLADRVVTNDSGLMHVAAALDRPLIALFGSSSPAMTPPLTDKATVLSLGLSCSPCFQRTCPLGHLDCLNKLTPDRVLEALEAS